MRIAIINSVSEIGSTGKIVASLAKACNENGIETHVYRGRKIPKHMEKEFDYRFNNDLSVINNKLKSLIFDNEGFNAKKDTVKLINELENFKPDLIHLHNLHGYYLNLELLISFICENNIPVIWTFHDCWPYTGHCSHYVDKNCLSWQSGCEKCKYKKDYPSSFGLSKSRKNYILKSNLFTRISNLTIVVPSQWLKQEVELSFFKNYPINVISSGIDLNIFQPNFSNDIYETYNLPNKKILLGVASVWNEAKGLNMFLELAAKIPDEFQMVLVGLDKSKTRGLPESVIGIPRVHDQEKLAELYSQSYAFLNLSSHETQGLTTIEAIACQTPVIVFDNTAIPESVNRSNGIVVPNRDLSAILEAINDIEKYTRTVGKNRSDYGSDKMIEKYLKLYKSVGR